MYSVLGQQHAHEGVARVGRHGPDHVGGVDVLDRRLLARPLEVFYYLSFEELLHMVYCTK